MIKNRIKGVCVGLVLAGLFFVLPFFRETETKAAEVTGGNGVTIDAEGNMYMTTYDRIATSATRYRTIGWTISRSKSGGESVRVKFSKYKPETVDPSNPQYCYNYYMVPKELLYQKIAGTSQDWAQELYGSGGTIYLDAIMTVVEGGRVLGSLSNNGGISGEVYTTYAGIANARGWADKEALKTHFGKEIYFGGNASLLDSKYDENFFVDDKSYLIYENSAYICSNQFAVSDAIPSGEPVYIDASLQKYYYTAVYEKCSGTMTIPVTVTINYRLEWDDGTPQSDNVTVKKTYEIEREYSYWKIKDFQLAYLDSVTVENQALPGGSYKASNFSAPSVFMTSNEGSYRKLPTTTLTINGGIVEGKDEEPEIPELDKAVIEKKVGKIKVRNDSLVIDGVTLLSDEWKTQETNGPGTADGETVGHVSEDLTIPYQLANTDYETSAYAIYAVYNGGTERNYIYDTNDVAIHTPVVCIGKISDEKEFNQQIEPTTYASLILGRNITVSVQTRGVHVNKAGYGARDYGKYASKCQVKFPFPVVYDGNTIEANQWITLRKKEVAFLLPVSVKEGNYNIYYRSIAYNATDESLQERKANLDRSNYVAYDVVPVTVVGRLSDFCITNVIDYPRWQEVFFTEDGVATGKRYFSGTNDKDGNKQREAENKELLPILAGGHTNDAIATVPGLGYQQLFSLQTIGNMADAEDKIWIEPSFYWISADGSVRKQVRLYEYEDLAEFGEAFYLTAENRTILEEGVQSWSGSYQIPPDAYVVDYAVDLKEYVKSKGRIKTTDEVFLKNGYVVVHFDIETMDAVAEGEKKAEWTRALSYHNQQNARNGYCNMWTTEGYQTNRVDIHGIVFSLMEGDVMVFGQANHMWTDYKVMGTH